MAIVKGIGCSTIKHYARLILYYALPTLTTDTNLIPRDLGSYPILSCPIPPGQAEVSGGGYLSSGMARHGKGRERGGVMKGQEGGVR